MACEVPQALTGEDLTSVALAMKENKRKIKSKYHVRLKELIKEVLNCFMLECR